LGAMCFSILNELFNSANKIGGVRWTGRNPYFQPQPHMRKAAREPTFLKSTFVLSAVNVRYHSPSSSTSSSYSFGNMRRWIIPPVQDVVLNPRSPALSTKNSRA
jgi:hypothetical protein